MVNLREKKAVLYIAIVISVVTYLLGVFYISSGEYSFAIECLSIFLILSYFAYILIWSTEIALIGFYIFYSYASALPGLYLVSEGAYLQELQQFGFAVNVFSSIQFYLFISLIIFLIMFRQGRIRFSTATMILFDKKKWRSFGIFLSLCVVVINLFFVYKNGGVGVISDRFQFFMEADGVESFYFANLVPAVFVITYGALICRSRIAMVMLIIASASSLLLLYSIGVKFSGFIFLLVCMGLAAQKTNSISAKSIRYFLVVAIVIIFLLIPVVVIPNYEKNGAVSGMDELLIRTPAQSQLFWVVHATGQAFVPIETTIYRLSRLFGFGVDTLSSGGIVELMHEYAPISVFERYRERNVVFTFGYPAVFVYAFGFIIAPLLHMVFVIFYAYFLRWLVFLRRENGVSFIFQVMVLFLFIKAYSISIRVITNGDLNEIYKLIIVALLILFIDKLNQGKYRRRKSIILSSRPAAYSCRRY